MSSPRLTVKPAGSITPGERIAVTTPTFGSPRLISFRPVLEVIDYGPDIDLGRYVIKYARGDLQLDQLLDADEELLVWTTLEP